MDVIHRNIGSKFWIKSACGMKDSDFFAGKGHKASMVWNNVTCPKCLAKRRA